MHILARRGEVQMYLAFPLFLELPKARPGQLYLFGCHIDQMSAQS